MIREVWDKVGEYLAVYLISHIVAFVLLRRFRGKSDRDSKPDARQS